MKFDKTWDFFKVFAQYENWDRDPSLHLKNKTEKVQSKTARQVCDREILFEYIMKVSKVLFKKVLFKKVLCKKVLFKKVCAEKVFWIFFQRMFDINFDKRQNF